MLTRRGFLGWLGKVAAAVVGLAAMPALPAASPEAAEAAQVLRVALEAPLPALGRSISASVFVTQDLLDDGAFIVPEEITRQLLSKLCQLEEDRILNGGA